MKIKRLFLIFIPCIILSVIFVRHCIPYALFFPLHLKKIGAHRANSISKFKSAQFLHKNIELDVVFNEKENYLDVNRINTTSIQLSFEDYISNLKDSSTLLWLDLKNLTDSNAPLILNKLNAILRKKKYLANNILIESPNPQPLITFSKEGFLTSFYLPKKMHALKENELRIKLNEIKNSLKHLPNTAISTDIKDYEILHKEFPSTDKYFWSLGFPLTNNYSLINNALKDKSVKVVLLSYKAPKGNR